MPKLGPVLTIAIIITAQIVAASPRQQHRKSGGFRPVATLSAIALPCLVAYAVITHHMSWWVWAWVAIAAFPYITGCLAIRKQSKPLASPSDTQPITFANARNELLPWFQATGSELATCGFHQPCEPFEWLLTHPITSPITADGIRNAPEASPNQRGVSNSFVSLWLSADNTTIVTLAGNITVGPSPKAQLFTTILIHSNDPEKRRISVSNMQQVSPFPPRPDVISCTVSRQDWPLPRMLKLHAALRIRHRFQAIPVTLDRPQAVVGYLQDDNRRSLAAAAKAGLFKLDEPKGVYRWTLWGAYYAAWKALPPFRALAQAQRWWRTKRRIRECGFTG